MADADLDGMAPPPAKKARPASDAQTAGSKWSLVKLKIPALLPHTSDQVAQEARARAWYKRYDLNGDGVLQTGEFRELLQSMGTDREKLHPKYVDYLLARTDADHDGIITLDEFLRVYDQLCDLDRVLCAPRRTPRKQEDLMDRSRVRQRPGMLCPAVPSRTVQLSRTTFTVPERYIKVEKIGEGAYGVICQAVEARDDGGTSGGGGAEDGAAGLDAVRETNPAYPFSLPEMLRFGILHDRTVYPAPLAETSSESSLLSDGDAPFFPDAPPSSNTATAAKVAVTGPDKT